MDDYGKWADAIGQVGTLAGLTLWMLWQVRTDLKRGLRYDRQSLRNQRRMVRYLRLIMTELKIQVVEVAEEETVDEDDSEP